MGWIHNKEFDIKQYRDLDAVLLEKDSTTLLNQLDPRIGTMAQK